MRREEQAHAKRFFSFLEGGVVEITASYPAGIVGTTAENLKAAAEGENEEWTDLYPAFAEIAKEEGWPDWRRERLRKRMMSNAEFVENKFPGAINNYGN